MANLTINDLPKVTTFLNTDHILFQVGATPSGLTQKIEFGDLPFKSPSGVSGAIQFTDGTDFVSDAGSLSFDDTLNILSATNFSGDGSLLTNITLGAADEVQASDGAGGFQATKLFVDSSANIELGDSGLAGASRRIEAIGSAASVALNIRSKGTGVINIQAGGTTRIIVGNADTQFSDGYKVRFNPNDTNAGMNLGANLLEPSSPVDGDMFYDSTVNQIKGRVNGAWVDLGGGGGGGGALQQTVMFSSNLDNVKTIYYFGKIVISVVNFDSVLVSAIGFESSTDGVTFTTEANLTALNSFIVASGAGTYYVRYTATYQAGKTETTGTQLTYTIL